MRLEKIPYLLSICKVDDLSAADLSSPFFFVGRTDEEISLVCLSENVPEGVSERDDGWRCFRVAGQLDFSLTGILSGLSKVLADNGIGIFAVSTFNTDYILVKAENYERSLTVLESAGYEIGN